MARKRKKRESPKELVRVAQATGAVTKAPRPVRETVVIHTTRERKRNAGFGGSQLANAAAMATGSVAGGAASVVVAEKAHMDPFWAGLVTSGASLALAQLAKKVPLANKGLVAASLGAGGLCGVQLLASYYARKQKAAQPVNHDAKKDEKRHADGDSVTRGELNDALSKVADQQNRTCDLVTALREEIKAEIKSVMAEGAAPTPTATTPKQPSNVIRVQSFRRDDDGYERNAYGSEDERNADFADERNAEHAERDADPWERDASGEERDADPERDAAGEERDADPWERDASGEERDADPDWERNADERDAVPEERDAFVDERDAGAEVD